MTVQLRYLTFSGFEIITAEQRRIVVDPFLSGSEEHGVPASPVALDELSDTDLVLVSHGAFDHLGQAIEIVMRSGALLACGPDVRLHALSEGIPEERIAYLLSGCTLELDYVSIKALDVRHISLFQSHGRWLSGQPLSFMIKLRSGMTIYHSGDTSLFQDLKLFGELHRPDLALICVGGVRSHGVEVVPLPPDEAALAAQWLGVRAAIPMHYRPDSDAARQFKEHVMATSRIDVHIMEPGETLDLDAVLHDGASRVEQSAGEQHAIDE
jgi:L-ascorbate metabolism protein UlaG (beta-lactamase superfamily)